MAWNKHGKHQYYYRTGRRNGQVYKQYFGRDLAAQLVAHADDVKRARREAERKACRAIGTRLDAAEGPATKYDSMSSLIMQVVLLAAGFYQQDRHAWRLRRA